MENMYFFLHALKEQVTFSICMAIALHSYSWANVTYALSCLTCDLYLYPLTMMGVTASDSVFGKWQ